MNDRPARCEIGAQIPSRHPFILGRIRLRIRCSVACDLWKAASEFSWPLQRARLSDAESSVRREFDRRGARRRRYHRIEVLCAVAAVLGAVDSEPVLTEPPGRILLSRNFHVLLKDKGRRIKDDSEAVLKD